MLKLMDVDVTIDGDFGKKEILKKINLTLEKKKIYVMTGPNGGGKSTIAKTIMGIVQPDGGQIFLDEEDITQKGITERAKLGIGYAFQTPARFKGLKVRDLLKLASGDNVIDDCQLLYDVGLCSKEYLDREINATFSGGELKRIEIASILARNLKVAVFDEPEAGIDLWSFQRLTDTFEKMHEKNDTTIVIISHQERILRLADVVITVADGSISELTSHEKFLNELSAYDLNCDCKYKCLKGGPEDAECDR